MTCLLQFLSQSKTFPLLKAQSGVIPAKKPFKTIVVFKNRVVVVVVLNKALLNALHRSIARRYTRVHTGGAERCYVESGLLGARSFKKQAEGVIYGPRSQDWQEFPGTFSEKLERDGVCVCVGGGRVLIGKPSPLQSAKGGPR